MKALEFLERTGKSNITEQRKESEARGREGIIKNVK